MRAKVEVMLVIPSLGLPAICHGELKPSYRHICSCFSNIDFRILHLSQNTSNKFARIDILIYVYRALAGSGGLAVGLYYLLPPQIERWNRPKGSGHGGHGHGHDEHGEGSEGGGEGESHEGEESDEGAEGENVLKEGGEESERSDDPGSEGGENDTPDTSGDEENAVDSGKNVEGVQFKGPSNAGPNKQQTDTRRSYPDSKGGNKKRIESHYGQKQGVAGDSEQDPKDKDLVHSKIRSQTSSRCKCLTTFILGRFVKGCR